MDGDDRRAAKARAVIPAPFAPLQPRHIIGKHKAGGGEMNVQFYDAVEDGLIKFAVIVSKSNGKWVFCRHKERTTFEIPGGHREAGEDILETAKRELSEETGALAFAIVPICVYSVIGKNRINETGEETYGMLYYADITSFQSELHSEMEQVYLLEELPDNWTYPLIQPALIKEAQRRRIV